MSLTDKRVMVIADYPGSTHKIGDIINYDIVPNIVPVHWDEAIKMPHIFRQLGWWEFQTIETIVNELKFVELIEIPPGGSYFLKGDKNNVGGINITTVRGKIEMKILMGDTDHWYEPKYLIPANQRKLK